MAADGIGGDMNYLRLTIIAILFAVIAPLRAR